MAAARTQPGPPARPAWADPAVALTLVAVVLAGLLAFRHRGAIADPDALDMAAGMANGLKRGVPPGEWLLYGRLISPGAYLGFHALVPLLRLGPEHTIGFLNAVSLAAMALLPWPLFALYRRRLDPAVAAAATLITSFTPLVWSAGCSFHPIGPAVLLLLLAVLAHGRSGAGLSGAAWFAAGAALGGAALCLRAEVALALPALLLAAWRSPGRLRALAAATASIAIASSGYLLAARGVTLATGGGSHALASYGAGFIGAYWGLRAFLRTLIWAPLAMGIATIAIAVAAVAGRRDRGGDPAAGRGLGIAALWALPTILFWLPNQVFVARHYLLAVPALAGIVAELALSRAPRSRLALLSAAIVLANLFVPEGLYGVWNRAHPDRPKWPNGTFFSARARDEARIRRERRIPDLALGPEPASAATAGAGGPAGPGAFVEVDWGGLAALLYGMAVRPPPVVLLSASSPIEGAVLYRYRQGDAEIRMLLIQPEWLLEPGPHQAPARAILIAEARAARRVGRAVVVPREVAAAGVLPREGGPPPLAY